MGGASCSRAPKVDFIISDLLWFSSSRLKFLLIEVTSYNELLMCPSIGYFLCYDLCEMPK